MLFFYISVGAKLKIKINRLCNRNKKGIEIIKLIFVNFSKINIIKILLQFNQFCTHTYLIIFVRARNIYSRQLF